MKVNHLEYSSFEYENVFDKDDQFELGDVVINNETYEIGVIIQCHGNNEYRTDMFGNCSYGGKYGNIEKATLLNILINRPKLL